MDTRKLIAAIDAEISRLQQVKLLLSGNARTSHSKLPVAAGAAKPTKRRKLSAAARAKIAAAQRERWAKFRKSAK
jgi:endonuclease/exonuclease/phosphatase (EEP) superfamily protein YafD